MSPHYCREKQMDILNCISKMIEYNYTLTHTYMWTHITITTSKCLSIIYLPDATTRKKASGNCDKTCYSQLYIFFSNFATLDSLFLLCPNGKTGNLKMLTVIYPYCNNA